MRFVLIIALWSMWSCKNTDFAGASGRKQSADQHGNDASDVNDDGAAGDTAKNGKGGPDGGVDSGGGEGGLEGNDDKGDYWDVAIEDEDAFAPKKCTADNIFIAKGTVNCPQHYAGYTADDSDSPQLGCCPLPFKNILKKDPPVARQTCASDEVATGVQGRDLMCTKINTAKYSLGSPAQSCYVGSGFSGGQGSANCGAPPDTMTAMVATFGSDACIGQPYGALIVGRTSKKCTGVTSAQLLDNRNKQAVIMYQP